MSKNIQGLSQLSSIDAQTVMSGVLGGVIKSKNVFENGEFTTTYFIRRYRAVFIPFFDIVMEGGFFGKKFPMIKSKIGLDFGMEGLRKDTLRRLRLHYIRSEQGNMLLVHPNFTADLKTQINHLMELLAPWLRLFGIKLEKPITFDKINLILETLSPIMQQSITNPYALKYIVDTNINKFVSEIPSHLTLIFDELASKVDALKFLQAADELKGFKRVATHFKSSINRFAAGSISEKITNETNKYLKPFTSIAVKLFYYTLPVFLVMLLLSDENIHNQAIASK